jgi:spermidine synthase
MERLTREEIAKGEFHCHRSLAQIHSSHSQFQHVEIIQTEGYGRGLFLDGRIQHVELDEYIYSESMVHPAMALLGRKARRVLCIGGGPGGIVRELIKYGHVERIVQVEIDEEMARISRTYLSHITQGAWEDPRVSLVINDALRLLEQGDEVFDLIINDASEPFAGSPAMQLFSTPGLELYKRRLDPNHGTFVTWAGSAGPLSIQQTAARIAHTVRTVFPFSAFYLSHPQSYGTSWLSAIGAVGELNAGAREPRDIDAFLAETLQRELRLYDGLTHRHMFTLPKDVRKALAEAGVPITAAQPLDFNVEVAR